MIERIRARIRGRRGLGWLVLALDVQERFGQVRGPFLAAAVTLMAFLSLFPLLVVAIAVAGFVSSGTSVDVAGEVVDGLGLERGGTTAEEIRDAVGSAEDSRRAASVVGLVGLLWSGLGVVGALQNSYNAVWQVEGRGLRDKLAGLVWLAGALGLFVASFAATAVLAFLPGSVAPLGLAVGFGLSVALWSWSSKVLANRAVGWRALLPGAILGAVGFEALKALGALAVPRMVSRASALYGSLGVVFALLAWLFFFGRLVVYSGVLNVVLWERGHGFVETTIRVPRLPGDGAGATRSGRIGPAEADSEADAGDAP